MNLHKLKLKHKLFLIIFVVIAVLSLGTILSFVYTVHQYDNLLYRQTANSLSFFSDELNYRFREISNTSSYIAYDASFQDHLAALNQNPYSSLDSQNARTSITDLFNHYYSADLTQITVVTEEDSRFWYGATILDEPEAHLQEIFRECDAQKGRLVWFPSQTSSDLLCARKILKAENLSLEPLGYLIIGVNLDHIIKPLMENKNTDGNTFQFYIHSSNALIYSSEFEDDLPKTPNYQDFDGPYSIQKIGEQRMFLTQTALSLSTGNWDLALAVAYDDIFHSLRMVVPAFLCSLLLAAGIAATLSGSIARKISLQFHALVSKMNAVGQEGIMEISPAVSIPRNSHDEMTLLNSCFDQMIVELKKLIEESYVKQLLITQAELKALEQQVNPHFLYNTLNTINWLAKKAGEKEISTIAESLGSLLQNTLRNKETTIPLGTELEIVFSYLKIQQIRFEDLIVTAQVDPELSTVLIPKMTIQPLIENALFHSQEEAQLEYRITLDVRREQDQARIQVSNSGSRIDVDILEHLRAKTVTPKGNGIGLLNIDARLRILFGEGHGLHFENADDMAIVWFSVPLETTQVSLQRSELS